MCDPRELAMIFRKRVREIRGRLDIAEWALAELAGVREADVVGLEFGTGNTSLCEVVRYADALGVSVDYLLGRSADGTSTLELDEMAV
jgi:predicted transcriptional regulator